MKNLFGETTLRFLAFGGLLVVLFLAFLAVQILLVPFVAALFVVYLFDPAVVSLQRRGMDRSRAFLGLLCLTILGITVALMVMPSWLRLEAIGGTSETFTQRVENQLKEVERWIDRRIPMFRSVDIAGQISDRASAAAGRVFEGLPALLTAFAVNLLLVPFIAYFLIRDGKTLKRRIVELVPNRYFEMTLIMFNRIDQQIGGYLRGRLIECILVGVTQALCMGIASLFVTQQQILLISVVCGVTTIIPYIGPLLGTFFGALIYLASGLPMSTIYGLIAASTAAHAIDNIFIAPAVLSQNVDLHPLTVALVLVIGGELLGTLGLLIAVPVTASVKVVAQEFYTNYRLQVRT
jgi:predicted PurR-regulated permease PerM